MNDTSVRRATDSPTSRRRLFLVIAGIPILALLSFVCINMFGGKPVYDPKTTCLNNLREIHKLCVAFAKGVGNGYFPHSPKGGHATLQLLVDHHDGLMPRLFLCRTTDDQPAEIDAQGKFHLDENSCSYGMVPWKLSQSDPASSLIAFDRAQSHPVGRNVVFLDTSVKFLREEAFQELFEEQRKQHGHGDPEDKDAALKKIQGEER